MVRLHLPVHNKFLAGQPPPTSLSAVRDEAGALQWLTSCSALSLSLTALSEEAGGRRLQRVVQRALLRGLSRFKHLEGVRIWRTKFA